MHELIVGEIDRQAPEALHDGDHLLVEIDAHDLGLAHLDAAKQEAQGHDRVGGVDGRGRDLGQQRLEHEIIVVVDQLDVELVAALALELLGGEHAAKAAAENEDLFLVHAGKPPLLHGFEGIPTPMLHCVKSCFWRSRRGLRSAPEGYSDPTIGAVTAPAVAPAAAAGRATTTTTIASFICTRSPSASPCCLKMAYNR